jgi:hypothetical protein
MQRFDTGNYFPALHFSEQYLTFSQSRAHFLRHSKGRLQRWQILGGKPFLVLAFIPLLLGFLRAVTTPCTG